MKRTTLLAIAGSLLATQAAALPCANTSQVERNLRTSHGETLAYSGELENSNIIQLFMNESSESWSIMVQVPSRGLSCLVSSGYGREAAVQNPYFRQVQLTPMS